jgi:pseudaminic acid cytidylyltransferase
MAVVERCLMVIPARGGSKRLPRKNIRSFCGRPMLEWSIEAALSSGLFAEVVVSTDDDEIAAVAEAAGARVPFRRGAELVDDFAGTRAVIKDGVERCEVLYGAFDAVCCLYATAPFVRVEDLRVSYEQWVGSGAAFCMSVARYRAPVQRAMKVGGTGRLEMMQPEYRARRSQDLEEAFYDAGQFYWGRREAFLDLNLKKTGGVAVPYVLEDHRVQDIDDEADWRRAEWLFRALREEEGAVL